MQMYVHLGKILGQHETVVRARDAINEQKKVTETAQSWARAYGRYEDCGDGYREDQKVQESILDRLISLKIAQECVLKRLKCEFKENYPQFDLSAFLVETHKDNKRRVRS